ncbi:MAG: hypothetical protein ACI9T8_000166, partial [Candidatus Saccharimonadales bacterium]
NKIMKKSLYYLYAAQLLFISPSILYWLDGRDYSLSDLGIYGFFPLLGLVAFTMMWFHLMVAGLKHRRPEMFDYKTFYRRTSNIVLALIVLHPLLLIYKSVDLGVLYFDYAGEVGKPFIAFGTLAFLTFMIYEVVERLRERPAIKNNWAYVVAMNRIGFILIFAHGLQLGQHLQSGPLKVLWLFFGLTAAYYMIDSYRNEIRSTKST